MKELKELCRQDNNLVLVHDLNEAMVKVRVSLLQDLWQEIECGLQKILDFPNKNNPEGDISEKKIERFVRRHTKHGLYYRYSRSPRRAVRWC